MGFPPLHDNHGPNMLRYFLVLGMGSAYFGLVSQATLAVDPDVLSKGLSFLVQSHVLGQLCYG